MKKDTPTLDEEKLRNMIGKENPYRVPEDYFDRFADRLMSRLADEPLHVTPMQQRRRWLPYVAAAACLCGVVCAASVALHHTGMETQTAATSSEYLLTDDEMETYMASSFYDEYTLYSYLTGEEL